MATVTIQKISHGVEVALGKRIVGRVTGNAYTVNALGQATVDTQDAAHMYTAGWVPAFGGVGLANSGVTTIDFGAFPGSPSATTTIVAGDAADPNAILDVWVAQVATADHSADEHAADPPLVSAVADGLGNIIIVGQPSGRDLFVQPGTPPGNLAGSQAPIGQTQLCPVGKWSVAWAFSP